MHIPDGFFNAGTSLAAGTVAAGGIAVALRRTREVLGERQVPLAALTAAFVFAAQMLNFPVASGTSGHLMGGVLAAVLVGPWAAVLCLTVVLGVQALLFADGGVTALGLNIVNIALVGGLGGHALYAVLRRRPLRKLLPPQAAAGLAAFASVPLAAAAFTVELA
ncbi:MAG TPA: energy-coupling factor ABC transporter permease, partial [Acidimicrobiales bacterium]